MRRSSVLIRLNDLNGPKCSQPALVHRRFSRISALDYPLSLSLSPRRDGK
jgi:hypothetical protein